MGKASEKYKHTNARNIYTNDFFVDNYGIGKILSMQSIGNGLHSDVYTIETTKGIFTLKIYKHKQEDELQYEIDLLNLLKDKLPVPKLIKNKQNKYTSKSGDKTYIIYSFIEGKQPQKITEKHTIQIGKFLGAFHNITENKIITGNRNDLSLEGLKNLVNKNKNSILEKGLKAKEYLPKIEQYFQQWTFPETLPKGPIHLDIKQDNSLFDNNDNLNGVIDFDNSFIGPLLLDVCKTIMWWCAFDEGKVNKEKLSLFLNNYQKQRKLTNEEKQYFHDMLQFAFISHAAWDLYLNANNKKTPDWYMEEVVFKLFKIGENMQITREEIMKI